MTLVEKTGDLFLAETDAIGHGVNCKGLMGAGIALAFRNEFPKMYEEYRNLCLEGLLKPGDIFPFKSESGWTVINIASQEYPGPDAKLEWVRDGLRCALIYCEERGLASLALPRIGCGIGGLDWEMEARGTITTLAEMYPDVNLEVWSL